MANCTSKELKELQATIEGLGKLQDHAFDAFCKEHEIKDESIKDFVFDCAFNGFEFNILREKGVLSD